MISWFLSASLILYNFCFNRFSSLPCIWRDSFTFWILRLFFPHFASIYQRIINNPWFKIFLMLVLQIMYGMVKHDMNLSKRWKYVLFHDLVIYITRPAFYRAWNFLQDIFSRLNMYSYYKNFTTEFDWSKLWQYGFWLLVKTNFQLLVVALHNLILACTNLMNT